MRLTGVVLSAAVTALVAGPWSGVASASSLAPPSLYFVPGAGNSPVAVGDVEGDGRPDVVTGPLDGHEVLVQTADPRTHVLLPGQRVDVGEQIESLAGGDLDHDRRFDVLVGTRDGVLVLRGTPSGLSTPEPFATTNDDVRALWIGGAAGSPSVFYRTTPKLFRSTGSETSEVPIAQDAQVLAIGDITGDDAPDVVTAHDGSVTVLDAVGGGWSAEAPEALPSGFRGSALIADADGDDDADLLLSGGMPDARGAWSEQLLVMRRQAGAWAGQTLMPGPGGAAAVGDADANGTPDLIVIGDGFVTDAEVYRLGRGGPAPTGTVRGWTALPNDQPPVLADVTGDGRDDLVGSSADSLGVSVQDDGAPQQIVPAPARSQPRYSVQRFTLPSGARTWDSGDVTGDDRPDLVVATGDAVQILPGRADGGFSPDSLSLPDPHDAQDAVTVADLDADGDQDVVAASPDGLVVFRNDGHGLTPGEVVPGSPVNGEALSAVDLFGDARPELGFELASPPTQSGLLPGGLTGAPITIPAPWRLAPGDVASDVDGDGAVDGLGGNAWLRQYAPAAFEAIRWSSLDARHLFAFADDTGDGRPDFAAPRTDADGSHWVDLYPSRADRPPSPWPVAMPVDFRADWVGGGDLDGDGRGDLVARRGASGPQSLVASFGTADGGQGTFQDLPLGRYDEPQRMKVDDLDGDGRADLSYVTGDPVELVVVRVPRPPAAKSTTPPTNQTAAQATATQSAVAPQRSAQSARPARTRIVIPAHQSRRTVLAHGLRLRCLGTRRCGAKVAARGTHWHRFTAPGTRLRLSYAQRRTVRRRHALTLRLRVAGNRSTRHTVRLTRR